MINDPAHKRYFGYDVRLEPSEDGNEAQIRIEPLTRTSAGEIAAGSGWTLLSLPKYPVIPNVKVGDTVALDLLVNAATGQKIVDYLTLARRGTPDASQVARDFTLADVELSLMYPRVFVNGKPVEATANAPGGTSGAVVWLYLAGHGRFVLSLSQNAKLDFQKIGVAAADALWFREGSTEYRVECGSKVAPGPGAYNLYVAHEADWRPRETGRAFLTGSADNPEWVVGKR
jgi:hypothetical protein